MKSLVNISIDDISPHPRSSLRVLDRCYELIDVFPKIKFSLFVPTAYWRTRKPQTTTQQALQISQYPEFCEALSNLDPQTFEICFHGHWHGIPGASDNNEFENLDYDSALDKATLMRREVDSAGLNDVFKDIFRPPAWRMSPDAFSALSSSGFELFAITNLRLDSYQGAQKEYLCTFSDQFPPFAPLRIEEKCGIVYHACEWDRNYMSREYTEELKRFLLKEEKDIEFCFLEEML